MGDRANIYIKQHPFGDVPRDGIFIYVHWCGSELPKLLQAALQRGRERWGHEPYLGRIIFSEVAKMAGIDELTGCGLSTYITDNSYNVLVVDSDKKTVGVSKPPDKLPKGGFPTILREVKFSVYCEMTDADLEAFREETP